MNGGKSVFHMTPWYGKFQLPEKLKLGTFSQWSSVYVYRGWCKDHMYRGWCKDHMYSSTTGWSKCTCNKSDQNCCNLQNFAQSRKCLKGCSLMFGDLVHWHFVIQQIVFIFSTDKMLQFADIRVRKGYLCRVVYSKFVLPIIANNKAKLLEIKPKMEVKPPQKWRLIPNQKICG